MTNLTIENNPLLTKILGRKGQIVTVSTKRPAKVRKGSPELIKVSKFQCRVGVTYDNMAAVKEKRANGDLPAVNAGLPWGEWIVGFENYLISHKGEIYVRCSKLNSNYKSQSQFFIDGQEVSHEVADQYLLASEKNKDADIDVFNIKLSSVVELV
jgi:hypothetical protein